AAFHGRTDRPALYSDSSRKSVQCSTWPATVGEDAAIKRVVVKGSVPWPYRPPCPVFRFQPQERTVQHLASYRR
ncbi:hypothetical protein C7E17_26425, partial [Stenotrophomonas maltophilia]